GRLAAAARPDEADDLLITDLQIDLVERVHRGAEAAAPGERLGDIADDDLAHATAAYFPCQCSVRRSMREIMSSRPTPISPMMRIPKNTSVIRKNVPASWMMKPSPSWAAMSSAATTIAQLTAVDVLIPVKMCGIAAGSITLVKSCRCVSPRLRPLRISCSG